MKINWELILIILIISITISNIVNAIRDTLMYKYTIKNADKVKIKEIKNEKKEK